MPTHQRFKSDDLAVVMSLRLVFQEQFAVRNCRPEVALQGTPFAQLLIHRGSEEANLAATFVFGAIERRVGIREQRPLILSVPWVDGNSDTEVEVKAVAVDFNALFQGIAQPVREQLGA